MKGKAQAELSAVLDSVVDAVIIIDAKGVIQRLNKAAERLFGHDHDLAVGQNVSLLTPSPHKENHDTYIRNYIETGHAKVIGIGREAEGLRADGSRFPMELTVTEVEGQAERRFVGVVRDISARKARDERIGQLLFALENRNDELESVLDQMGVGVCALDDFHTVRFFSKFCQEVFSLPADTTQGRPWGAVCPLTGDARTILGARIAVPEPGKRIPVSFASQDGSIRHLQIDVRFDPRDNRSRLMLFYDVTEAARLRQELSGRKGLRKLLGGSPAMQRLYGQIERLAAYDTTVLVTGETGTGKELVARALHELSTRGKGPMVPVNTAGLTDTLIASQFFGHSKGAFTGAVADHKGIFEAAQGGTVLLDEIGDLPLSSQASLLRVLQEREILRVGESQPRQIDVRVIAATHRNLANEVAEGRFRQDLLYRLQVATIEVPALRNRREDIPLLASHFLEVASARHGKTPAPEFDRMALDMLMRHNWPGNVRELQNVVESALLHSDGKTIDTHDIWFAGPVSPAPAESPGFPHTISAPSALPSRPNLPSRKERLLRALEDANGSRSRAAEILGIGRTTLYRWALKYGVELP
jgi:PAS domain S-box-containing protein